MVEEEGALNVFDRAYINYRKFDSCCENGTRFVTRLKGNAIKEVVKGLPVDPDGPLKKHQIVRLGNPYTYKMKHKLRLIETVDTEGKPVIIITNDFDLTAEEIGDIYKNRWQIEIFFFMNLLIVSSKSFTKSPSGLLKADDDSRNIKQSIKKH